jgi:hypothetical protein
LRPIRIAIGSFTQLRTAWSAFAFVPRQLGFQTNLRRGGMRRSPRVQLFIRTVAWWSLKVFIGLARNGGMEHAPGWLDFVHDPSELRDTPSARAISQIFGGDFDAPLVSAQ